MNKAKAYKRWNSWLSKCPIEFRTLRSPTVDIESIEFDFDSYVDEEIKPTKPTKQIKLND